MACQGGLDEYGDHGTVCPYGTGLIYRHDIIVGAYSKLLTEGKIEHTVEQRHLIEGSGMKPADIMAKLGPNGEYLCLDVGVTSTTRDTVIDKCKQTRLHAAPEQGNKMLLSFRLAGKFMSQALLMKVLRVSLEYQDY
eukprot:759679_1